MIRSYDPTETYVPDPPVIGRDYVMADGSRLNTSGSAQLRRMPMEELATKIRGFAKLTDNWDGNGAKPIDPRAIEAALEMVGCLAAADAPVSASIPSVTGSVVLGWQQPGFSLELEIVDRYQIELTGFWDKRDAFVRVFIDVFLSRWTVYDYSLSVDCKAGGKVQVTIEWGGQPGPMTRLVSRLLALDRCACGAPTADV